MPRNKTKQVLSKRLRSRLVLRQSGQSLIETLVGFAVLIPLGLFSFDLTVLFMASQLNRQLAENAARAAANQPTSLQAIEAAVGALRKSKIDSSIQNATVLNVDYSPGNGQVIVTTEVEVKLPVTFPGVNTFSLRASALQPIVGIPADI